MERLTYDDDTAFTLADDASTVARVARMATADELRAAKFDDWTGLEVLGHVADMADIFAERVRRIVTEDRPKLASADQDAIHAERKNNARDPMEFAKRIQAAHGEIVRLLGTPADRARTGLHGEWGEIDAAHVAAYQARHAHEHVTGVAAKFPPH
ncbi:MAG: DinB family protein [Candidatus Limnocylindria bacterium]|nr:DinB family protein [Candidatus Limnocylindria bacterium]